MCFVKRLWRTYMTCKISDLDACQCQWFNRNIRSKSKQYLRIGMIKVSFISVICLILFTQVLNCLKSLFLTLMFHIGEEKVWFFNAKYSQFMAWGSEFWLFGCFYRIVDNIVSIQKVPKFTYSTLLRNVYLISVFAFDKIFQKKTLRYSFA